MAKSKLVNKIRSFFLDEGTPLKFLIIGVISITLIIIFKIYVTITFDPKWNVAEAWVETGFLFFCLNFLILQYKKNNEHLKEAVMGELLAIYTVSNATYFVETLQKYETWPNIPYGIVYSTLEFLLFLASFAVFVDHLSRSENVKREKVTKIIINILMLLVIFVLIVFVFFTLFEGDKRNRLVLVDELIYATFGTSLTFAVMSLELNRMEKTKNKRLEEQKLMEQEIHE